MTIAALAPMPNSPTSADSTQAAQLLIVDGDAYAYRAFFAIRKLNSPTGQATNAIYGFIRMLTKMQAKLRPSHLIVVWDGGLAQERMTLLPEYKAHRDEMPADLEQQLDQIIEYLHASGVSTLMKEGCEADDCIAVLARQATEAGLQVVIASADKDFMQLVSPQIQLFNPNDKSETLWGAEQVRLKAGVEPTQIVDWLSLVGDSVDNIPGVKGVGPKTATDLLRQFGSVEELYRRLPEVSSDRLRANLQASVDIVRRNQQLVRLNEDVPCELSIDEMLVKQGDDQVLGQLYSRWGFRTLLHELEQSKLKDGDFFNEKAGAV
jgi:DNA polymerase-1